MAAGCEQCPMRGKSSFKNLPKEACLKVDKTRASQLFKEGQELPFGTGKENGFYCIQEGHIKIESAVKAGVIRICGPGDIVGYENTGHVAHAMEVSKVCFINRAEFLVAQNTVPEIADGIIQALIKILSIEEERIIGLENHSIRNRTAAALLSLARKFGTATKDGVLLDVKMDRKTLAKLAGTVVESIARVLTEFGNEKIVKRSGRKIHIVDEKKLARVSCE